MFLSRDFSSDDNRDPVHLHACNNGARDVCDALENCASAKLTVVVYCNTYGPYNIIYKTNTYRARFLCYAGDVWDAASIDSYS